MIRSTFSEGDEESKRDSMLEKASRYLASPKSLACSSHLVTLSDHNGVGSGMETFGVLDRPDRTLHAIRIESFGIDERDVDIDSAIVLHNFALAHLLLSRVVCTGGQRQRFREGAEKVSALAYRTLSPLMNCQSEADWEELIVLQPTLVLAAVSLLHCRVQILIEHNDSYGARQLLQRLVMLKDVIEDVQEPLVGSQVAAAA